MYSYGTSYLTSSTHKMCETSEIECFVLLSKVFYVVLIISEGELWSLFSQSYVLLE